MKNIFLILLVTTVFCACRQENPDFQNGDIIFQTSTSRQSQAIQIATHSKYSHVGIVLVKGKKVFVYEAVQPVKLTPLEKWIKRGENGHYVLKRLKNSDKILTKSNLQKMQKTGKQFMGKNYDLYFEWSDSRIYCSELVWKIYKQALNIELGERETLKDFNLDNDLVKKKLAERYGKKIPLDEWVISPAAIFDSDKLLTVYEN